MTPAPKVFLQEQKILLNLTRKSRSGRVWRKPAGYRFGYISTPFFPIEPGTDVLVDTLRLPSGYNSKWWKVYALSFDTTVDEKGVISDVETESVEQFSNNTGS